MVHRATGAGLLLAVVLPGCRQDGVVCAPLIPLAVAVDVRDSATGASLVAGAFGVVQGGRQMLAQDPKADTLRRERLVELFPDTVLVGGGSAGQVEVRIEHEGYLPWARAGVETRLHEGGPCPVWETAPVTARLEKRTP